MKYYLRIFLLLSAIFHSTLGFTQSYNLVYHSNILALSYTNKKIETYRDVYASQDLILSGSSVNIATSGNVSLGMSYENRRHTIGLTTGTYFFPANEIEITTGFEFGDAIETTVLFPNSGIITSVYTKYSYKIKENSKSNFVIGLNYRKNLKELVLVDKPIFLMDNIDYYDNLLSIENYFSKRINMFFRIESEFIWVNPMIVGLSFEPALFNNRFFSRSFFSFYLEINSSIFSKFKKSNVYIND
ncbi:MAG: hypothetical protein JXR58_07090 [Bacteroidales bacterium]|nr:hypothetical protein [Bacteroidales bacterium]